jgi:hypothetical protein
MSDRGHDRDDAPRILKAVITRKPELGRREFVQRALVGAATVATGMVAAACGGSSFDVAVSDAGTCQCHVVCTCESEGSGARQLSVTYQGSKCTCNTVCSCDTVCTCDSEGGGGGDIYYYPA